MEGAGIKRTVFVRCSVYYSWCVYGPYHYQYQTKVDDILQSVAAKAIGPVAWVMPTLIAVTAISSCNSGIMVGSRFVYTLFCIAAMELLTAVFSIDMQRRIRKKNSETATKSRRVAVFALAELLVDVLWKIKHFKYSRLYLTIISACSKRYCWHDNKPSLFYKYIQFIYNESNRKCTNITRITTTTQTEQSTPWA